MLSALPFVEQALVEQLARPPARERGGATP